MKARRAVVTVGIVVACASCGGGSSIGPDATAAIAGTWHLATINGLPLPVSVQTDSGTFIVRQDSLTIAEGGLWSETAIGSRIIPGGAQQTRIRLTQGTWTRSGATVILRATSGTVVYQGSLNGTQLVLTEPITGFPFLFVHAIPSP